MKTAPPQRAILAAAVLLFCSTSRVMAQDWAKAMFDATSFDFGTISRGTKAEHRFAIKNIYQEDVHVAVVNSSCGCTSARISQQLLKKGEKADLVATVDTRNHSGRKDAVITVVFDSPFSAEVQIPVYVNISSNLDCQPDVIYFGSVSQGTAAKQEATVHYRGRRDWQIVKTECANLHLQAQATETGRTPGSIDYALSVTLNANAPLGYFQDQVVLVTNDPDPRSARVSISVQGKVQPVLSTSPPQLLMGIAIAGEAVTRNVVVKGGVPFRIVSAQSNDARFQCKVSTESKPLHVIPVTFLSNEANAAGKANAKIQIETDLPNSSPAEVAASVQVVAGEP